MAEIREPLSRPPLASLRARQPIVALVPILVAICMAVLCASTVFAQVRASYLYSLSSFAGRLPYDWVRLYVDRERDETYVIYGNQVRVFSASGMEVFGFGDDLNVGQLLDIAVDRDGDILLLSYKDLKTLVTRCNFRGVPTGPIEISSLPAGTDFNPNRMVYRNGLFYFASLSGGSVLLVEAHGKFRERIDLMLLAASDEKQRAGAELMGFTVDPEGNIFFSIPVFFKVYKLSPDGKLAAFGRPGSAAGRFGVIAGIAVDSRGNVLVADRLKCVVMAFDKNFSFLAQFGYRGTRPQNLIIPDDLAVDRRDRLYVSQAGKRGVSVFALAHD
jgi:hypothetical protein